MAATNSQAQVPGGRRKCLSETNADTSREPLAVTNAYFMLMIELPTATPPLAMIAVYKETDVTIRIRSNLYYSAEYRIAVHPTIRPRSEYEANIRYSPKIYSIQLTNTSNQKEEGKCQ